jgi:hypothetical protein
MYKAIVEDALNKSAERLRRQEETANTSYLERERLRRELEAIDNNRNVEARTTHERTHSQYEMDRGRRLMTGGIGMPVRDDNPQRIYELESVITSLKRDLLSVQTELNERERNQKQRIQDMEIQLVTLKEQVEPGRETGGKYEAPPTTPNEVISDILKKGSKHLDYLKSVEVDRLDMRERANYTQKLFNHLVETKEEVEEKYNKLLETHNGLVEVNRQKEEMYTPNKVMEVAENNAKLKDELKNVQSNYEY